MEYTQRYVSPLGGVTLAADGEALTGLWFDGQRHFASTLSPEHEEREVSVLSEAAAWLDCYFAGREPDFTPPLRLKGTAFQRAVWELLLTVPYGKTTSYGELAARLGNASARAVGGAVGRNPVSLIVPCHRVLGRDGGLSGYAGGVDKKRWLLKLEGAETPKISEE